MLPQGESITVVTEPLIKVIISIKGKSRSEWGW